MWLQLRGELRPDQPCTEKSHFEHYVMLYRSRGRKLRLHLLTRQADPWFPTCTERRSLPRSLGCRWASSRPRWHRTSSQTCTRRIPATVGESGKHSDSTRPPQWQGGRFSAAHLALATLGVCPGLLLHEARGALQVVLDNIILDAAEALLQEVSLLAALVGYDACVNILAGPANQAVSFRCVLALLLRPGYVAVLELRLSSSQTTRSISSK